MGKAFLCKSNGGGGGGLTFRVLGGTSAPSNPKPNDIWVNTNEEITSYIFSATEPEGYAPGMVWISTGTSSTVAFNALKKNAIEVYPISAKQYVSGAWVDVSAKSYQGGEWVDWWNGELYISGVEYAGGFVPVGMAYSSSYKKTQLPTVTKNADSMTFTQNGSECGGGVVLGDKINLSRFNTLYFEGTVTQKGVVGSTGIGVWTELGTYLDSNRVASLPGNITNDVVSLSLDGIDVECYIGFYMYHNGSTVTVKRMWLE
jgi:predicted outer membrane repeat protein